MGRGRLKRGEIECKRMKRPHGKRITAPVLALIIISALGVMAGSVLAPVEARFISLLAGNNPEFVGMVFAFGTLGIFLFSIYLGRKSVEIGKGKMALFGLLVGLAYPLVYATSLNLLQYLFGRLLWSIAAASSSTIMNAIFQDVISRRRDIGEISGIRFSVQSVSGTVGALIGGALADLYGLRAPYYVLILLYVLSLLLFVRYVYPIADEKKHRRKRTHKHILKHIITNPYLFLRFFTEGITQSHWAMEPILFPLAIYSITGSSALAGAVFGAMGLIAMVLLPIAGRLVDRTSPITGLKLAFVLYVISLIILSFARNYALFFVGALLLSAGKAFNGPSKARIEVEHIDSSVRGEYLGYFNAYDTITGAVASLATGYLLKWFDYWQVLFIFAVFTFTGFAAGFWIFSIKKSHSQQKD